MTGLHFHSGRYDEAVALVMRHHYSRRAPANVQCVGTLHECGGLFGDYGDAIAACMFSFPVVQWKRPVLELSRLVRTPESEVNLTSLISKTANIAKMMGWSLLISYADNEQNHHGGIYQAASWQYNGQSQRQLVGCVIDGKRVHGKSCYNRWGTRSPAKLTHILRKEVLPDYDEGKHLYWRALTKEGKRRAAFLGLQSLPYPKPDLVKDGSNDL